MRTSLKNVHCIHKTCFATFYDFGVNPITKNFPFFFSCSVQSEKTAENPGEFMHSLVQKNSGFFCTLPHEFWLRITKVTKRFSLPVMSDY